MPPRPRVVSIKCLSSLAIASSLLLLLLGLTTLHTTTHFPLLPSTATFNVATNPTPTITHPIAGFWHIAKVHQEEEDGSGGWKAIVRDQHKRLLASGLLTWAQKVHVTAICNSTKEVAPLLTPPETFNITHGGSDWHVHEFPTLQRLADYCHAHPDSYVWYMHTLGSRFQSTGPYYNNTWAWRSYLEHFVVTHYQSCLHALDGGFNTCGAFFLLEPIPHFAGNIWWARCSYVKTLPPLRRQDSKDQAFAQWWLGRSRQMRPKICHMPLEVARPGMGLYDSYMDPQYYQDLQHC